MAKLFAKHIKVEEQRRLLQSCVCGIACGTPHRLCKLADEGALSTDHLRLLIIDLHVDAKQRWAPQWFRHCPACPKDVFISAPVTHSGMRACRTILDIPETRGDLRHLLSRHAAQRVSAGKTSVALIGG